MWLTTTTWKIWSSRPDLAKTQSEITEGYNWKLLQEPRPNPKGSPQAGSNLNEEQCFLFNYFSLKTWEGKAAKEGYGHRPPQTKQNKSLLFLNNQRDYPYLDELRFRK